MTKNYIWSRRCFHNWLFTRISFIKINDHNHPKYVTTQKFDKLTSESFVARFSEAKLASKNYIVHLVKKTDLMIN